MGATSSLCSGSKSVQVVNSTERRPDRLPGGDQTPNNSRAPAVIERTGVRVGNNVGPTLTESEAKWIQQTNNNSTRTDHSSNKGQSGNNEMDSVDRRQHSNSRRKDDGCNLSVYDNLPGSLGKHGAWGDGLNTEGSSLRYSAYKSRDGLGGPEYVDGYLINQNSDLNISDTSLLGSESCDSWHMGRKAVNIEQRSCSSSPTSIQNPSLDNGNRSDQASMEANSKHSSNGFSRNRKSESQDSLTNKDYDNLPPLGKLRPSHSDSGNLAVIGEAKEGDIKTSFENGNDFRPSRIASAKCERVSSKPNVSTLRQAKSLTLPMTSRNRPKSARKRDVSANRDHLEERAQGHFSDAGSSDSEEDEMLSIPDETRGAGDNSDDLSDGLSGLGSTPDLALEALDAFPDSTAPTPLTQSEPSRVSQPRPPSFDIKSVLDDKGKSNIGKKGSERSISSIVITPAGEGKDSTETRIRSLPPDTSLEEVGAMIAGDIIFRRSQGSMTQAEYQGIVKAYRIILEQLLAYQGGKDTNQSPNETAKEIDGKNPSTPEQRGGESKSNASPHREQDSGSDLEEKLDQVTEVFELEFAQKLVERGNGLTEADITQYLTEHAQNVKSIKTVLKTQKETRRVEKQEVMTSVLPQQQKRLAMLDEVARLLYLYSTDISSINADDIDQLCEAILESIASTPAEEEDTLEKEASVFGKQVDNAMLELNDHFMQTVSYKRDEATAEELSQIIERHLIEETATVRKHESERVTTINKKLSTMGKTKEGFHVKVPELDARPDDMNKKRRKLEQALKRILLGRKPIGEEEISDILDKYRREQRVIIEDRDAQRLKRRDELKKKLVMAPTGKPKRAKKDILKEMKQRYEESMKTQKQDKVSSAIHTMTAQKIVDSSSELSKDLLTGLIREHQRRVTELENIRRREREKPIDTHLDVVARDKAEDEKRNRERRIALNRATDVKQRAEDVLASYRDATLLQHSLRPVHLPKSPNSMDQPHDHHRHARLRHANDDTVPDSGYVDGMSVESTSVTPSLMTGTPISSPGGDYSYLNNRLIPRKQEDAESVRAEDYETLELLVNDVIDHCVDDYSRAENLYSWLVSQEIPDTNSYTNDGESPLYALTCIAKGQSSHADVFIEMTRLAGLTCEKIEGFTKTPDFSPGEDVFSDLYRHSWNAVFIDNRYFLLDASEGSRREKFFREHFFCTGPSIFALTHFPDNQRWQLMERLVTKEDFASALKVWPAMFVYDIRPLNSKSLIRTYDGKMCITFSVKNHSVLCHLEYAGPGPEVDPRGLAYHVDQHTNNVDNEESFHLTLPQEGVYFFTLLVNDPEDEVDLPVCQYRIDYQDELL